MIYKIEAAESGKPPVYVSADMSPTVMRHLVMYIQIAFEELDCGHSMEPQGLARVLRDVYGFDIVTGPRSGCIALDMYDVWDEFVLTTNHEAVMAIRMFDREGLRDRLADEVRMSDIFYHGTGNGGKWNSALSEMP